MPALAHIPVLLEETIKAMAVQPGGRYIDCTLGSGGHAAAILERSSPGGQLLGIDADPEAVKIARARLEAYAGSTLLINENFVNLQDICVKHDFLPVNGILFDLGLSSLQLNGNGRGFSFQHKAPLDMRLNPSQEVTAADIVNTSSESELARLIKIYGEERYSHQIARHIIRERPIRTTLHLARAVEQAIGAEQVIYPLWMVLCMVLKCPYTVKVILIEEYCTITSDRRIEKPLRGQNNLPWIIRIFRIPQLFIPYCLCFPVHFTAIRRGPEYQRKFLFHAFFKRHNDIWICLISDNNK